MLSQNVRLRFRLAIHQITSQESATIGETSGLLRECRGSSCPLAPAALVLAFSVIAVTCGDRSSVDDRSGIVGDNPFVAELTLSDAGDDIEQLASLMSVVNMPTASGLFAARHAPEHRAREQRRANVDMNRRLEDLSRQLKTLQRVIDPGSACEILTIARMAEEVSAREALEERIRRQVDTQEKKLDRLEDRFAKLQFWIWGTLVAIISGLIGAVFYLTRRLALAVG